MSDTVKIVLTALLSSGTLSFIQYLIARHDKKQDEKDGLRAAVKEVKAKLEALDKDMNSKMKKQEKDSIRTQLLVLIFFQPDEKQEILTLGEHYFRVLKGNWYMTSIFNRWLEKNGEAKPEWFKQ